MDKTYSQIFVDSFAGYANYLWKQITEPHWHNYFYSLIALTAIVLIWEMLFPRQKRAFFRKDFWLDTFYIFFNFFIFSLIGYNALSDVFVLFFKDILGTIGINNLAVFYIANWPKWAQLLVLFIVRDFIQWNIHRMLHHIPVLWQFHKIHHSVQQMGVASHLRYHFAETIIYRFFEYIPLAMIGFGINDFFIVHMFTLFWGHLNHANIHLNLGKLQYIFNNPKMHAWHHAKQQAKANGTNFGLSLSLWDFLFGTAHVPHSYPIELGFEQVDHFPNHFWSQLKWPFQNISNRK